MDRSRHIAPIALLILALLIALAGCGGGHADPTPGHRRGKPMRQPDLVATKPVAQSEPTSPPSPTARPQAATAQPAHPVKGVLETIHGVRVLRVWGSPAEMGYAHGYLLADELVRVLKGYLVPAIEAAGPEWTYERAVQTARERVLWPEGYAAELEAMAEGMGDALGAPPTLMLGTEQVRVDGEILMVLNAFDRLGVIEPAPSAGCAAVWGERTDDGHPFVCAIQQNASGAQHKGAILIVRRPDQGLAHVCAAQVGMVSGAQGMNAEGVVVVAQAVGDTWQTEDSPCYADVHTRLVLETVGAGNDMADAAKRTIERHPVCGASILMVAQDVSSVSPLANDEVAAVIEYDRSGVTVRRSTMNGRHGLETREALVAMNHHLAHGTPRVEPADKSTQRYGAMAEAIMANTIVYLSDMQRVAQGGDPEGRAQTAVYFEPGARLTHVALRTDPSMPPAPHIKPVTFAWNELMAPLEVRSTQP